MCECVTLARLLRKLLLSVGDNPPIQTAIDAGAVQLLMPCLRGPTVACQFDACWASSILASGTSAQRQVVMSAGFVPALVPLLDSPSEKVRDRAAWAVGQFCRCSPRRRRRDQDFVDEGDPLLPPLIRCAASAESPNIVRHAMRALSRVLRLNPRADVDTVVVPALPLVAVRLHHGDTEVVTDACWALFYLSDAPAYSDKRLQAVLNIEGLVSRVVELTAVHDATWHAPALKVIGNLVLGSDAQTQVVLDAGALRLFPSLLTLPSRFTVKEVLRTLSNIATGPTSHIQSIFDANLLSRIVELSLPGQPMTIRENALWTAKQMARKGTRLQQLALIDAGVLSALCSGLSVIAPEGQSELEYLMQLLSETLEKRSESNGEVPSDGVAHPPPDISTFLDPAAASAVQSAQRSGAVKLSGLAMEMLLRLVVC